MSIIALISRSCGTESSGSCRSSSCSSEFEGAGVSRNEYERGVVSASERDICIGILVL